MNKLIPLSSIGLLAEFMARAIGWSPVGRTVVLRSVEGPDAHRFSGVSGKVVRMDSTAMLVSRYGDSLDEATEDAVLRLTPRHKGWSAYAMMVFPIAVIAEAAASQEIRPATAIAVASIDRERRS